MNEAAFCRLLRIQLRRVREHEFVEGAESLDNIKLDLLDYYYYY